MFKNGLNLNLLRIFHACAHFMSFTRASKALNLTQPGISIHMKALEDYYGAKLFDRLGKKVILTQAGEILFKFTNGNFGSLSEVESKIRDLQDLKAGKLSLGASISIGTYILPDILAKFRLICPAIEIHMDLSSSQDILDKVLNNSIELGFIHHCPKDYPNAEMLTVDAFKEDELVVAVSRRHAWAKKKTSVSVQELAHQTFLLPGQGSGTRKMIEDILRRKKISLDRCMEMGTTGGVKGAVEANLGISILSKFVVAREVKLGLIKALPLQGIDLKRALYFISHKNRYHSQASRAFINLLK